MKQHTLVAAPCALLSLWAAGCQSGDPAPQTSRVAMSMRTVEAEHAVVDGATFDFYASYDTFGIELREVTAHGPEGWVVVAADIGWVTLVDDGTLPVEFLGEAHLAEGDYDALRLVIDAALVDGVELRLPSGAQTGLKIHEDFCLVEGAMEDLDVVIDLDRNIRVDGRGELFFQPVIHVQDPPGCDEPPDPEPG